MGRGQVPEPNKKVYKPFKTLSSSADPGIRVLIISETPALVRRRQLNLKHGCRHKQRINISLPHLIDPL